MGLDLSLTSTGMAVISKGGLGFHTSHLEAVHNFKTKGTKSDTLDDRKRRLSHIAESVLSALWGDWQSVELVVVENPSYGSQGGAQHDRSGLWWMVVQAVATFAPVAACPPATRAKYIAGHGRADKATVLAHATERYVGASGPRIRNDDEADAVGLADMGARYLGYPLVPDRFMPDTNMAAMDGVLWP